MTLYVTIVCRSWPRLRAFPLTTGLFVRLLPFSHAQTVVEEAKKWDVKVHRVSQGSGIFLLPQRCELRSRVFVCVVFVCWCGVVWCGAMYVNGCVFELRDVM